MSHQVRVEVNDLFDKFHAVMALIWSEPNFRGQNLPGHPQVGAYWFAVEEWLEEECFLAGCARRVYQQTERLLTLDEVRKHLQVCDLDGVVRPGPAGEYISSGFDWGRPEDEQIEKLVIAADQRGDLLKDVRLFVQVEIADP